jgi:hypothetical protein
MLMTSNGPLIEWQQCKSRGNEFPGEELVKPYVQFTLSSVLKRTHRDELVASFEK